MSRRSSRSPTSRPLLSSAQDNFARSRWAAAASGGYRSTPLRTTSPSATPRPRRWLAQNRQGPPRALDPVGPGSGHPPVLIAWGRSVFFTRPSRRRDNLCPTVRDIGCWTAPGLSWYREALGSERRGAGSVILGDLRPISRQVCLDRTVAEGVQLRAAVDEAPGGIQPLGEHRDLW